MFFDSYLFKNKDFLNKIILNIRYIDLLSI